MKKIYFISFIFLLITILGIVFYQNIKTETPKNTNINNKNIETPIIETLSGVTYYNGLEVSQKYVDKIGDFDVTKTNFNKIVEERFGKTLTKEDFSPIEKDSKGNIYGNLTLTGAKKLGIDGNSPLFGLLTQLGNNKDINLYKRFQLQDGTIIELDNKYNIINIIQKEIDLNVQKELIKVNFFLTNINSNEDYFKKLIENPQIPKKERELYKNKVQETKDGTYPSIPDIDKVFPKDIEFMGKLFSVQEIYDFKNTLEEKQLSLQKKLYKEISLKKEFEEFVGKNIFNINFFKKSNEYNFIQ